MERSIYQRQSPLTQRSLGHSISESKSVDIRKPSLSLRDSLPSSAGTPTTSPGASGRLKIRSGDEKATISRIWEALYLSEGERRYAWNVLKGDTAAQKIYGCRLRVILGLKKEYVDLTHQRQAAIRSFLMMLNENHTKASTSSRKRIAELVLSIRSLTSRVTFALERTRAQCKLPLNLPLFSAEAISQNCTESWYARLLTENIFTEEVVIKLMLLIGFFDDPDKGEFVGIDTVSDAVAAFYKRSVEYGVWITSNVDDSTPKEQRSDQTGIFTSADVSLFLLLGLPIPTLKPMDFSSLPEMLSQFLETAFGAPDMPVSSDEIRQLLIKEGQRITEFRKVADEYLHQGKEIVVVPVQHREETDQYEVYSTRSAPSQRSGSGSLFTKYHAPTDGSSMPKNAKPPAPGALPRKSKASTDGGIHAILKKIQGELCSLPRPLSNIDRVSMPELYDDAPSEVVHTYRQCVHSSGLCDTPDAPSLDEDMPTCTDVLHKIPPTSTEDECQHPPNDDDDDLFLMPAITSFRETEHETGEAFASEVPTGKASPDDVRPEAPVTVTSEEPSNVRGLIIYRTTFLSPTTISGSSYDLTVALP